MKFIKEILFISILLFSLASSNANEKKDISENEMRVVGFLPTYRAGAIDLINYTALTDLIFFSITPNSNGTFKFPKANIKQLIKLQKHTSANNVNLHICIGGWGRSEGFKNISQNIKAKAVFIKGLISFMKKYKLQGADIDWEYPSTVEEKSGYHDLLVDLKKAFKQYKFKLSTSVPSTTNTLKKETLAHLDYIYVMAYDMGFPHSSLEKTKNSMNFWKKNVNKDKLIMGVPFYERFKDGKAQVYSYFQNNRWNELEKHNEGKVKYLFNTRKTISKKIEYLLKEKFRGIMIWELGQDSFKEDSLLNLIKEKLN